MEDFNVRFTWHTGERDGGLELFSKVLDVILILAVERQHPSNQDGRAAVTKLCPPKRLSACKFRRQRVVQRYANSPNDKIGIENKPLWHRDQVGRLILERFFFLERRLGSFA